MYLNFTTKLDDEASVLGFLCHIIKMQPLLPSSEDLDLLDEASLIRNIKVNVMRYEDSKVISQYEKLGEIVGYFTRNYLNNPNFLHLVFNSIYELPVPYNTKETVKNINTINNILSSVKTTKLIDQITMQDYEEMTYKCILRRRLEAYTEASTKFIREK